MRVAIPAAVRVHANGRVCDDTLCQEACSSFSIAFPKSIVPRARRVKGCKLARFLCCSLNEKKNTHYCGCRLTLDSPPFLSFFARDLHLIVPHSSLSPFASLSPRFMPFFSRYTTLATALETRRRCPRQLRCCASLSIDVIYERMKLFSTT